METSLEVVNAKFQMEMATNSAEVSREIVLRTAVKISGRQYVCIEGWQAIALTHGCVLSSRDVKRIDGGVTAIGEVRRIADGAILSTAEGYVGDDESTWGGREEYAKRAMAQTRAMSRAARSAFAHIVVMIDKNLKTTPAEEVPSGGFHADEVEPEHPEMIGKPVSKGDQDLYFKDRNEFSNKYPGLELIKENGKGYVFAKLGTYKKQNGTK